MLTTNDLKINFITFVKDLICFFVAAAFSFPNEK